MSMIVNLADNVQRDSESEEQGDQMNDMDKYSNASRDVSPDAARTRHSKPRLDPINFEASNALLHNLFAQGEYDECKSLIGEITEKTCNMCEYAMAIRGTIARHEGELEDALHWFQQALEISGNNWEYYKEIGRIYLLLGRFVESVQFIQKALAGNKNDSRCYFWLALALMQLKNAEKSPLLVARDVLIQAPEVTQNVQTLSVLAQLQDKLDEYDTSVMGYSKALELEPENHSCLSKLGQLHLRQGNEDPAFFVFGKALTYYPFDIAFILPIGYIMQVHGDHEVALNKYRVAADKCDYNGCLWNNIAVCLFSKGKLAAAHSCLKKAAYLQPLDYRIYYNLGIVHHSMGLFCSAIHFLKASQELNKEHAGIVGAIGTVLSSMNDVANARRAYTKALKLNPDPQTVLNYAIFEYNHKGKENAEIALKLLRAVVENEISQSRKADLISRADHLEDLLTTGNE